MGAFLALDQGTTSSRALVFDGDSYRVTGVAQHEFRQHFPRPGWVEHDAEEILATQWRAAQEAHRAAGEPQITAVGITNQRETVVVFDRRSGKPIHHALVWQDRRTAAALAELASNGRAARVKELTGLPMDPYFSAAKIAWILDAVPGARQAAARGELAATTVDGWLIHRLTDGAVLATEPSNASRTSLYDLSQGDWSDELLELFRVPRACLPEIRPSAGPFGNVAATGWPICGVLGDQQAALFGQGCLQPGAAKCTYGTGAFLLQNCGTARPNVEQGVLGTVAWRLGDRDTFATEGSVLVCGALVQWLRDGLGIIDNAAALEPLARSVPDTGGVVVVPAFAGLGTPHWDPQARGLIIGLTRGTTRAHLARAALEAMAYSVREVQLAVAAASGHPLPELRVDGGAVANDLLLQLQAAISGIPVRRPAQLESTALGACRIAMLGCGGAATPEQLPPTGTHADNFPPEAGVVDAEAGWRQWREAVDRSRGWAP
ncbi:MAG: glycerol kinase [Planctomycetota bacterium]